MLVVHTKTTQTRRFYKWLVELGDHSSIPVQLPLLWLRIRTGINAFFSDSELLWSFLGHSAMSEWSCRMPLLYNQGGTCFFLRLLRFLDHIQFHTHKRPFRLLRTSDHLVTEATTYTTNTTDKHPCPQQDLNP